MAKISADFNSHGSYNTTICWLSIDKIHYSLSLGCHFRQQVSSDVVTSSLAECLLVPLGVIFEAPGISVELPNPVVKVIMDL